MALRFRRRPRLGPLRFNVTERGLRSVSIKVGPFTWNPRRRRVTTDLPGGLYHVADLPTACRCGHSATAHQHYRQGIDCALCDCTRYRRSKA